MKYKIRSNFFNYIDINDLLKKNKLKILTIDLKKATYIQLLDA